MEHTVEKLSGNKVKISFQIPAEDFENAIGRAYTKARGKITVPGFRPGKAPRKLIERMYGANIFYEDALEELFPDAYTAAVEANDLKPVGRPELGDIETMESGKDLAFTCEVFVMPEIKLGEYKGVTVESAKRVVSDEEVDERIEQERKRVARSIEVTDRPVENDDSVGLDYAGTVDGVPFEGGTAQNQTLVIGSGNFIPGFEEQMVGMTLGEERDLNVTFPSEYHSKQLAGKDAVFHVKVNAITREELPELNDDFASEVSEFDTFAEYRDDLRAQMQKTADEQAENMARQRMLQTIVEAVEIDVPEPMVEDKLDEMLEQMNARMRQQGFTLERYMQLLGQNEKQLRDMYRGEALNAIKSELVIDEIVKVEDVKADDETVQKLIDEFAESMGQGGEKFKEGLTDGQREYFEHRCKIDQVMDMLWENASVVEPKPEEAKAETETPDQPQEDQA